MKNAFDFDFFCSFPSFWWSGGGYGSATVTGRYFFSFFFLVKRPQWLSESLWWVNCFLFFVAVVCCFFKDRSWTFTRNFFFLIQVFLLIIDFDFLKLLSSLTCTTMMAFKSWRGNMSATTREVCHAHFSWSKLSCCSKDETRGAFCFFLKSKALHLFSSNLICFRELWRSTDT